VLRGTLAAVGAYYFAAAAVFVALMPVRYSLPRFGDLYFDPLVTILAVITAVGVGAAAVVAYSRGGIRAFSVVALLAVLQAASALLPFVAAGPAVWLPPSDLAGPTPATAIALSFLPALPALLIGVVVARLALRRGLPIAALEAGGAYYLTAVAMSLPIPQLDLRMTLPFTATFLPDVWHAAVITVLAIVAALVLRSDWPLRKIALVGGVIGLAGAAPGEIPALVGLPGAYWPVSLAVVPVVTAAIAVIVVASRRAVAARKWLTSAFMSRPIAAAWAGAAVAFVAVGSWSLLVTMPNSSDRNGPVQSYVRTGDERKIVACVVSGRGEELLGSQAQEEQGTVTVAVRLRRPPSWYFHDLAGISLPVVVSLRDPLGSRAVIDEWSGQTVQEVSSTQPSAFGPWC